MKRRDFVGTSAAVAGLGMLKSKSAAAASAGTDPGGGQPMKAGFARVSITPPVGTTMMGFGSRDMDHGCEGVHDEVYVRALLLEHGDEKALVMGFDLCFLGREETDRFKGAIGRVMDLSPRQILMNSSHNHVGPAVGTWYSAGYEAADRLYLNDLERATVRAAREAKEAAHEVTVWSGATRSYLPLNRRRKNEDGRIENRPNPGGYVYDKLPLCLLKDREDKPVCLLFSISTHPSMMSGFQISAEYPGVAMRLLDEHLGTTASLFLQGVGGDSKPRVIGEGVDRWQPGTWELMEEAGGMVAREVIEALNEGLSRVTPDLQTASVEMEWALDEAPPRSEFEAIVANTKPGDRPKNVRYLWAAKTIERLERGDTLPSSVPLTAHGVKLGEGLRIVGIEGEAVAGWGRYLDRYYSGGITFPLGYCDGTGLYLPTSEMLPGGGYEVVSYWEYGYPAPLRAGMEKAVEKALRDLRDSGVA
jgi:hypothetical protein